MAANDDLLMFPIGRIEDGRLRGLLEDLADALLETNDPDTLRKLGQSLKMLGDFARSEAFKATRDCW